mmetsp:Transcript_152128/g.280343  ORF Transcript_152128/g.280343 Transcript_152128/m.280343 type:complete len:222 (-) Transcript_152128:43-708(-)
MHLLELHGCFLICDFHRFKIMVHRHGMVKFATIKWAVTPKQLRLQDSDACVLQNLLLEPRFDFPICQGLVLAGIHPTTVDHWPSIWTSEAPVEVSSEPHHPSHFYATFYGELAIGLHLPACCGVAPWAHLSKTCNDNHAGWVSHALQAELLAFLSCWNLREEKSLSRHRPWVHHLPLLGSFSSLLRAMFLHGLVQALVSEDGLGRRTMHSKLRADCCCLAS